MQIDWRAPFELAFELGLFLVGALLVLFVAMTATIIVYGLIRSFVSALRVTGKPKEGSKGKFRLKSVD